MARSEQEELSVETIPEDDEVYRRVHKTFVKKDGTVGTSGFRFRDGEMSVEWSKYSTPEATRENGPQDPEVYGVARLGVQDVRKVDATDVVHAPLPENVAHANVVSDLMESEAKVKMRRLADFVIPVPGSDLT